MGAKVIVECPPQMCELLRTVKGISQVISVGDRYPYFDVHAKLMTLPGMFRANLDNIPADVPYLHPDPQREAEWKQRISGGGFKIGIAWQGSQSFASDKTRSIPLSHLEPLAKIEGVRLMSLQKNFGTEQIEQVKNRFAVEQFDPPLDEGTGAFMDTAALMRQLDLVIHLRYGNRASGRRAGGEDVGSIADELRLALAARAGRFALVSHDAALPPAALGRLDRRLRAHRGGAALPWWQRSQRG